MKTGFYIAEVSIYSKSSTGLIKVVFPSCGKIHHYEGLKKENKKNIINKLK